MACAGQNQEDNSSSAVDHAPVLHGFPMLPICILGEELLGKYQPHPSNISGSAGIPLGDSTQPCKLSYSFDDQISSNATGTMPFLLPYRFPMLLSPDAGENMPRNYQSCTQDISMGGNFRTVDLTRSNASQYSLFGQNSMNVKDHAPILWRPVPVVSSSEGNTNGRIQGMSYSVVSGDNDAVNFNTFQDPRIDGNIMTAGHSGAGALVSADYGAANFNTFQTPRIDGNIVTVGHNGVGGLKSVDCIADNFNTFWNPRIDGSIITSGNNGAGNFPISGRQGEANNFDIHMAQVNSNLENIGNSRHVQHHSLYPGETGTKPKMACYPIQSSSAQRLDGSFLTLGVGGHMAFRSLSNVNNMEISSISDNTLFSSSNTPHNQQAARSSLNHGYNTSSGFLNFQNRVSGFSGVAHRVDDWNPSNNGLGVLCCTDAGLSSSPLLTLSKQQSSIQHNSGMLSNVNIGLEGSKDAGVADMDSYRGLHCYPSTSMRTYGSKEVGALDFGQVCSSGSLSDSVKIMKFGTQPTSGQFQKYHMNTGENLLPRSSMVSSFVHATEISTRTFQSGPYMPESFVRPSLGACSDGEPAQSFKGLHGPASGAGQVIPAAKGSGLAQTSNVLSGPSHKRIAIQPASAAPWLQRKKIAPPHFIAPSMCFPSHNVPTVHVRSPNKAPPSALLKLPGQMATTNPTESSRKGAPAPYIKWQGSDGTPQLTDQKCLVCKRDLSLAPEGPISRPTMLPATAVLPCGHVFHDHCLQLITPVEQSRSPPCIPCAISEF